MNPHEAVNEALLSAYLDGEVTTAECAQVEQLLRESTDYQQALDEIKLLRTGMQQLPRHQLEEGFARSVLETAERQQPLPESERIDRRNEQEMAATGSMRSWVADRWQGLVLTLTTAAALLLAVRLMLPEQAEDLVDRNNGVDDNRVTATNPDSGNAVVGHDNTPESSDSNSSAPVNRKDQEKLAGTPDSNDGSTKDPAQNNTVPGVNNPVVSQPKPEVPGLEQFVTNRLLFVVEVAMTPEGVKNRRMDQVLMNHGILYDRAIEVDRPLEQAILKSRYLKGVVAKRDNKADDYMNVDLVYVVCNGQQVDDTTRALSDFPGEIAGHRFNLAILPKEVQTFQSLHQAVATQWDEKAAGEKKVTQFKARAGRLLTDLVLLSGVARPLGTASLLKVDPVPLPDKPAVLPSRRPPALIPGDGGQTMKCEVLFVVRHLPAAEKRE